MILTTEAQNVADTLLREMRGPEFPMIDGSYIYQHYKSPFLDKAIDALREKLSASVQRDTYVFNISATTGDPEKSARILNTLADIYVQEQISVKFEATEEAVAWLSRRVGLRRAGPSDKIRLPVKSRKSWISHARAGSLLAPGRGSCARR